MLNRYKLLIDFISIRWKYVCSISINDIPLFWNNPEEGFLNSDMTLWAAVNIIILTPVNTQRIIKLLFISMGSCSSNLVTQLIRSYGEQTVMKYAKSIIGTDFLKLSFDSLKKLITDKFNTSSEFSNSKNMNIFDQVISRISNAEQFEVEKLEKLKPYIPELDNSQEKSKSFFNIIRKEYSKEVSAFKTEISNDVGDKLDIDTYLGGYNL